MTNTTSPPAWDAIAIANQLQTIAGQSQSLMQRFLSRQPAAGKVGMGDASTVGSAFLELMTKMMSDPVAVANAQIGLFNEGMTVWRHAAERIFLMQESLVEPARDKRFKHPDWTENAMFSFIRESYLVAAKSFLSSVRDVKGLDPATSWATASISLPAPNASQKPAEWRSRAPPTISCRASLTSRSSFSATSA